MLIMIIIITITILLIIIMIICWRGLRGTAPREPGAKELMYLRYTLFLFFVGGVKGESAELRESSSFISLGLVYPPPQPLYLRYTLYLQCVYIRVYIYIYI